MVLPRLGSYARWCWPVWGDRRQEWFIRCLTGRRAPVDARHYPPRRLEDTPCFLQFPGDPQAVRYGEGVFVGYRHYDTSRVEPLFPFGHGLSYARFAWDQLTQSSAQLQDGEPLRVALRVRNVGERHGSDVVQLYVHDAASRVRRPEQELRAFAKVTLGPGEETGVQFILERRAFAFWDAEVHARRTEAGEFVTPPCRLREIVLQGAVRLEVPHPVRAAFDRHTPIRRFLEDDAARAALLPVVGSVVKALFGDAASAQAGAGAADMDGGSFFLELPVGKLVGLSRGAVSRESIGTVIEAANAAHRRADAPSRT